MQNNINDVQDDVDANETASNNADTNLQNQVTSNDTDITNLQGADVTLQNNINDVQDDVDANETASNNADTNLQNQVTSKRY